MRRDWAIAKGPGAFRLFLAVMVVVHHASRLALGSAAVFLFFSLSGFWIARMWRSKYRPHYYVYIVSRAWRLLPVFVLCSAISWVVAARSMPHISNWPREVFSSVAIIGYSALGFQPNVPSWSLDIELQFYVIAPLLIFCLAQAKWVFAACCILSIAASKFGWSYTVFPYLAFFAAGAMASIWNIRPTAVAPLSLGVAFGLVLLAASPWRGVLLGGAHPGPQFVYNTDLNVLVAACLTPLAIFTTAQKDTPQDSMFGDLSYVVYLLHWPVLHLIDTRHGGSAHRFGMLLLAFIVIFASSWLIWRYVDRPANQMRAAWVGSRLRSS